MTMIKRALVVTFASLAALLAVPAAALAAPVISRAPLDPQFKEQVAGGGSVTHSPIMVQPGAATRSMLRAADLPAYSLRDVDLLTDVRDQGDTNTCWAFAAMASLESHLLLSKGEVWDLSEDNLVMRSGFGPFADRYEKGGLLQMAVAYLARWSGPLSESVDPFGSIANPAGPVRKHVQGVVLVAPRESAVDNDALKAAVMTYGAVATQMYYTPSASVYNAERNTFLYTGGADPNHGVAIVGWDDSYSAGNFATMPEGDGAYLVRNSWGTEWGDGGYFWVSYYDSVLARADQSMALSRVDAIGRYTRTYGWDRLGWIDSVGLKGTADAGVAKFANRFTAKASEKVAAVGFYTIAPNAAYRVYAGPTLGRLTLRGSGRVTTAGYCTVPLTTHLHVTKGKKFVVAVRLDVPGTAYPVPLELPVDGYAAATASAGQSYIRVGSSWQDVTTANRDLADANVCLKAFTQQ
jgi:C1A family cysteine protease